MCTNIKNPFLNTNKLLVYDDELDENINIDRSNLTLHFKKIYVLCLKKNELLDSLIFESNLEKKQLDNIKSNLILYETSTAIISNIRHYSNLICIDKKELEDLNIFGYELPDCVLCLPIFNITFLNIKNYLDLQSQKNNLDNLQNMLVLNNYFGTKPSEKNVNIIFNIIKNLDEAKYWKFKYNCMYNFSELFNNRKFNFTCKYKLKNSTIKKAIDEIDDNDKEENYLIEIYKKLKYVDPSTCIKFGNFKLFSIVKNCNYTSDDIFNILKQLNVKDQYYLICNLLISKEYSHLILNNQQILTNYKSLTRLHIWRYLTGYSWIRFYMEECIKKTNFTSNDYFVFDIDTASKLPLYAYDYKNPYSNPYMTILVKENVLIPDVNVHGVINNNIDYLTPNRICNFNQFIERFNIFTTNKSENNIFMNIDFKEFKMAISGSCMTACLQVRHPLMDLFESNTNKVNYKLNYESFSRYCNEYYSNSDIDIMIRTLDMFEFVKLTKQLYNKIVDNIIYIFQPYANRSHIKLEFKKKLYIRITKNFIIQNLVTENITYEELSSGINTPQVKDIFNNYIQDYYNQEEKEYKQYVNKYPEYFTKVDNTDIHIYIHDEEKSANVVNTTSNISKDIKVDNTYDLDTTEGINIYTNFKAHISAPQIDHDLEIFPIKGEDFGIVSQFHLPCVRSYYNGSTVYMLPSCITAHMTYMNLDYKYVSGQKDVLEIINKYRMRGFGTWLNKNEINKYLKYITKIPFWKNLYNYEENTSPKNILSQLLPNNRLFYPRLYNADYYLNSKPIPFENPYLDILTSGTDYGYRSQKHITSVTINRKSGYVNPFDEDYLNNNDQLKSLTKSFKII